MGQVTDESLGCKDAPGFGRRRFEITHSARFPLFSRAFSPRSAHARFELRDLLRALLPNGNVLSFDPSSCKDPSPFMESFLRSFLLRGRHENGNESKESFFAQGFRRRFQINFRLDGKIANGGKAVYNLEFNFLSISEMHLIRSIRIAAV